MGISIKVADNLADLGYFLNQVPKTVLMKAGRKGLIKSLQALEKIVIERYKNERAITAKFIRQKFIVMKKKTRGRSIHKLEVMLGITDKKMHLYRFLTRSSKTPRSQKGKKGPQYVYRKRQKISAEIIPGMTVNLHKPKKKYSGAFVIKGKNNNMAVVRRKIDSKSRGKTFKRGSLTAGNRTNTNLKSQPATKSLWRFMDNKKWREPIERQIGKELQNEFKIWIEKFMVDAIKK